MGVGTVSLLSAYRAYGGTLGNSSHNQSRGIESSVEIFKTVDHMISDKTTECIISLTALRPSHRKLPSALAKEIEMSRVGFSESKRDRPAQ